MADRNGWLKSDPVAADSEFLMAAASRGPELRDHTDESAVPRSVRLELVSPAHSERVPGILTDELLDLRTKYHFEEAGSQPANRVSPAEINSQSSTFVRWLCFATKL